MQNLQSQAHFLDTKGLICPEPVMMLHRAIRNIATGEHLIVEATDPSSLRDIPKFCLHLGHVLQDQQTLNDSQTPVFRFAIIKG